MNRAILVGVFLSKGSAPFALVSLPEVTQSYQYSHGILATYSNNFVRTITILHLTFCPRIFVNIRTRTIHNVNYLFQAQSSNFWSRIQVIRACFSVLISAIFLPNASFYASRFVFWFDARQKKTLRYFLK